MRVVSNGATVPQFRDLLGGQGRKGYCITIRQHYLQTKVMLTQLLFSLVLLHIVAYYCVTLDVDDELNCRVSHAKEPTSVATREAEGPSFARSESLKRAVLVP